MAPMRMFANAGAALLVLCLGVTIARGREDYFDGATALTRVTKLKKGMTISEMVVILHPERMQRVSSWSSASHQISGGRSETIHALTANEHLVIICDQKPVKSRTATGTTFTHTENRLRSWEIRLGRSPREDIEFGRAVEIAGMRVRY